jgi:elongation factor 1 alpha-like protein
MDQRQIDMSALNISTIGDEEKVEEPPKMALAREKVIEEAKKLLDARGDTDKKGVSLVVVGKINLLDSVCTTTNLFQRAC